MSALPLIMSLAGDMDHLSVSPFYFRASPHIRTCRWPSSSYCSQLQRLDRDALGKDKSTIDKDGFQVCMDVAQFKPSELNVKVINNSIVVEGKHEEREDDHGYISRHFVRRYALPEGYDTEQVASTLSSDGVLTVSIPKPQQLEDKKNERVIAIQQIGPAHSNVKENQKDEEKAKL